MTILTAKQGNLHKNYSMIGTQYRTFWTRVEWLQIGL